MVVIFWLVDDTCPSNPKELQQCFNVTLTEKVYRGYDSVTAYVEKETISDQLIEVYSRSGVEVMMEFGKITWMVLNMMKLTRAGESPYTFVVISKPFKDAMFDSVVEGFKSKGFNFLF